jgi:hypothetical protein
MNKSHFNEPNKMSSIRVQYVYDSAYDENDPIIRKIKEYCSFMNIKLEFREFDSVVHDEDRDFITKLPAIQIYKKFQYEVTDYPDKNPIVAIRNVYEKFELEQLEYLAKKQIWDEKINYLKRIFKRDSLKTDSRIPITKL